MKGRQIIVIGCDTCKYHNENCTRYCLANPEQGLTVKYWLKYIPKKYSHYFYAKWVPFNNMSINDILPDSLFDI